MSKFLVSLGVIFLIMAVIAALFALLVAAREALKISRSNGSATFAGGIDPVEFLKALSAAPLWLALAFFGVGLCLLGSLYDGYRFADGGITNAPPVVESAVPSPSTDQ